MRVLFVNPSLRPEAKRRHLPVGLAYVMTAVKKAGIGFDFIDMDINNYSMDDLEKLISKMKYDVCALGCIVTGFRFVKKIAEIIKKINPGILIVAGNSVATSIPEILLKETDVDIAVMGEGDVTLVELLQVLDLGNDINTVKGLVFKTGNSTVSTGKRLAIPLLDKIGFPDWNLFELDKYAEYSQINANYFANDKIVSFPLNSARGCPFDCSFCYHVFKKDKYRKYSEDVVMDEIKRLHDSFGCNFVCFWDELTFENIKSVERMVNKIMGLGFKIGWSASIRANLFTKEHIDLIKGMKESGCDNVDCALENASPAVLNAINKRITVNEFIEQSNALWAGGVVPLTSVIFGYPQETRESIRSTLEVCEKCNIYPSVGFLLPLPGTPIYQWAKDSNRIKNEVEYLMHVGDRQDFHVNLTDLPDDEFVDLVSTGLRGLADRMGLELKSVFKTTTYQKPKTGKILSC